VKLDLQEMTFLRKISTKQKVCNLKPEVNAHRSQPKEASNLMETMQADSKGLVGGESVK